MLLTWYHIAHLACTLQMTQCTLEFFFKLYLPEPHAIHSTSVLPLNCRGPILLSFTPVQPHSASHEYCARTNLDTSHSQLEMGLNLPREHFSIRKCWLDRTESISTFKGNLAAYLVSCQPGLPDSLGSCLQGLPDSPHLQLTRELGSQAQAEKFIFSSHKMEFFRIFPSTKKIHFFCFSSQFRTILLLSPHQCFSWEGNSIFWLALFTILQTSFPPMYNGITALWQLQQLPT